MKALPNGVTNMVGSGLVGRYASCGDGHFKSIGVFDHPCIPAPVCSIVYCAVAVKRNGVLLVFVHLFYSQKSNNNKCINKITHPQNKTKQITLKATLCVLEICMSLVPLEMYIKYCHLSFA